MCTMPWRVRAQHAKVRDSAFGMHHAFGFIASFLYCGHSIHNIWHIRLEGFTVKNLLRGKMKTPQTKMN